MPLRKYENYQTCCWKKESNDCIFIGAKKKKDPELGTNFFLAIEYNCHGMCTFL